MDRAAEGLTPRITSVPPSWADRPTQWWAHVRACGDCIRFYEPPSHTTPADWHRCTKRGMYCLGHNGACV